MCGKKTLKNQQCWLQDVRCGGICGKQLKCGSHFCRKLCHRPGECEDTDGQSCQQSCGKAKKTCGHPDMENQCHAPYPCKEDKPCQSKIYITCPCQAQKQEMKCGASKSGGEGNNGKSLPCNDECARLERNRKLALALNIDQTTHVDGGDHVPYSTDTLNQFAEHVKWGQTQEREFRVFATSDEEKRLRFKPMKPHQRAFIHALAEDFGLDSESIDPEPHRHVMVWKTPRFVAAPHKTLAEALRVTAALRTTNASSANVSDSEGVSSKMVKASNEVGAPYNAFVISRPRFGLTLDELRAEVAGVLYAGHPVSFEIEFLPNEEVVMRGVSRSLSGHDLQQTLVILKTALVAAITAKGYGNAELCSTDSSLNILRRESDSSSGDGWSRVAAKKAAPRMALQSGGLGGGRNSFAALTGASKVTFAKKKVEKVVARARVVVPVADDWEAAELAEEEREKGGEEGGNGAEVLEGGSGAAGEGGEGAREEDVEGVVDAVGGGVASDALLWTQGDGTPLEEAEAPLEDAGAALTDVANDSTQLTRDGIEEAGTEHARTEDAGTGDAGTEDAGHSSLAASDAPASDKVPEEAAAETEHSGARDWASQVEEEEEAGL
ncbi:hypothetical protein LTR08_004207 [Meristemomyces frigidus]|nr:hypothetical protein LTR08_004207 [Meristemomyces frigidus]